MCGCILTLINRQYGAHMTPIVGARVILAGKDADVAGVPSERLCSIQVCVCWQMNSNHSHYYTRLPNKDKTRYEISDFLGWHLLVEIILLVME